MKKAEEQEIENEAYLEEDVGRTDVEKPGITLGQLGHMIWKHWVAAVITMLVGLAAGVVYSKFIKTPKYQATVQVMVIKDDYNDSVKGASTLYGYMSTDFVVTSVAEKLAATKKYDGLYLKDENGKDKTEFDLTTIRSYYTVAIPTVTGTTTSVFVSVTSTCKSEDLAIDVANFVVESTIEQSNDSSFPIYGMLNNSVHSTGKATNAKDSSTSTVVFGAVGTLAGLVLGAAYGIIRELTNTKVSSKTDLEALTGYKVIGMIPRYGAPGGGEITKKGGNKHE